VLGAVAVRLSGAPVLPRDDQTGRSLALAGRLQVAVVVPDRVIERRFALPGSRPGAAPVRGGVDRRQHFLVEFDVQRFEFDRRPKLDAPEGGLEDQAGDVGVGFAPGDLDGPPRLVAGGAPLEVGARRGVEHEAELAERSVDLEGDRPAGEGLADFVGRIEVPIRAGGVVVVVGVAGGDDGVVLAVVTDRRAGLVDGFSTAAEHEKQHESD